MDIGLIDADLIQNNSKHPNIALEKISSYHKNKGDNVKLLWDYGDINDYDKIYIAKVFTETKVPIDLNNPKIIYGGTGFFFDKAPDLPYEIEHSMPDYHLYDDYIDYQLNVKGLRKNYFADYQNFSIGFLTRGCFRKCEFCVNKKYDNVFRHANLKEFLDPDRKYIYLYDDNFLGYKNWQEPLQELVDSGRRFNFRQGLDIRLMTEEKANALSNVKYYGDFIFAFDHIKDKKLIESKLEIWRKHVQKSTKLYILCAYESQDAFDITNTFERIKILMQYKCLPYIMRYISYNNCRWRGMYINLARWCNQPNLLKKKSFREFCIENGINSLTYKYMIDFEKHYPDIAKQYFDMKWSDFDG